MKGWGRPGPAPLWGARNPELALELAALATGQAIQAADAGGIAAWWDRLTSADGLIDAVFGLLQVYETGIAARPGRGPAAHEPREIAAARRGQPTAQVEELDDGGVPGRGASTPDERDDLPGRSDARSGRLVIEAAHASSSEIRAARALANRGRSVVVRDPRPGRRTSDLLVDGVPFDVFTPRTANPDRIISAVAKKNSQAQGVIIDLSETSVSREQLGDVLARVRGAGATNIQEIVLLGS